ncbi:MAG: hypothetical protein H7Z43_03030, partial [Clostridia bacterium]|nr:hypothetical protein [Deltaproteobacteria bacterium]
MIIFALSLFLQAPDKPALPNCRTLDTARPVLKNETGPEVEQIAILECGGQFVLTYSKRADAMDDWSVVQRVDAGAPKPGTTWFLDGGQCRESLKPGEALVIWNHAVLAPVKAASGELAKWKPVEAYHIDPETNAWVKLDVKNVACKG